MKIEEIRRSFTSIFPTKFIKTAIWYGNKKGKDVDVFIILKNKISYNNFQHQEFDISYINEIKVIEMLSNFDPLITEPILTGQEIYGEYLPALKKKLLSTRTNNNTVQYLMNRAEEFYNWSQKHFGKNDHKKGFITLTFVISFINFANYYRHHGEVITFKKLVEYSPDDLLFKTMELSKNFRRIKMHGKH